MATVLDRVGDIVARERAWVVGVGNTMRGDDGIGPWVAARLGLATGRVVDAGTVPENFLGVLLDARPRAVLFVDAADHGASPGDCCLAPAAELAARPSWSHAPSLQLLSQVLAASGVQSWVLGIQPARLGMGDPLSAPVIAAGQRVSDTLARALDAGVGHA